MWHPGGFGVDARRLRAERAGAWLEPATELERAAATRTVATALERIRDRAALALVAALARTLAELETHAPEDRAGVRLRFAIVDALDEAVRALPRVVALRVRASAAELVRQWAPVKSRPRGRAVTGRRTGS